MQTLRVKFLIRKSMTKYSDRLESGRMGEELGINTGNRESPIIGALASPALSNITAKDGTI